MISLTQQAEALKRNEDAKTLTGKEELISKLRITLLKQVIAALQFSPDEQDEQWAYQEIQRIRNEFSYVGINQQRFVDDYVGNADTDPAIVINE